MGIGKSKVGVEPKNIGTVIGLIIPSSGAAQHGDRRIYSQEIVRDEIVARRRLIVKKGIAPDRCTDCHLNMAVELSACLPYGKKQGNEHR